MAGWIKADSFCNGRVSVGEWGLTHNSSARRKEAQHAILPAQWVSESCSDAVSRAAYCNCLFFFKLLKRWPFANGDAVAQVLRVALVRRIITARSPCFRLLNSWLHWSRDWVCFARCSTHLLDRAWHIAALGASWIRGIWILHRSGHQTISVFLCTQGLCLVGWEKQMARFWGRRLQSEGLLSVKFYHAAGPPQRRCVLSRNTFLHSLNSHCPFHANQSTSVYLASKYIVIKNATSSVR